MDIASRQGTDPTFIILIEGEELKGNITEEIISVRYTDSEEDMDEFELQVSNRFLQFQDHPLFQEGNKVEMRWGYVGNYSSTKVGTIKSIESSFPSNDIPKLTVRGYSYAHKMAGRKASGVWKNPDVPEVIPAGGGILPTDADATALAGGYLSSSDYVNGFLGYTPSDIAKMLARHYGFDFVVGEAINRKVFVQAAESDYDFLKRLAEKARWHDATGCVGFEFFVEGDVLHFHPPGLDEKPAIQFTYYVDNQGTLIEFNPESDSQGTKGGGDESTTIGIDPRRMTIRGFVANKDSIEGHDSLGPKSGLGGGLDGEDKLQYFKQILEQEGEPPLPTDSHTTTDPASSNPFDGRIVSGALRVGMNMAASATAQVASELEFREMKDEAIVEKKKKEMEEISASATVIGIPQLKAKMIVDFQGVGTKYSGNYKIRECTHIIDEAGYLCEMKCKRNAKGEIKSGGHAGDAGGAINDNPGSPQPEEDMVAIPVDGPDAGKVIGDGPTVQPKVAEAPVVGDGILPS